MQTDSAPITAHSLSPLQTTILQKLHNRRPTWRRVSDLPQLRQKIRRTQTSIQRKIHSPHSILVQKSRMDQMGQTPILTTRGDNRQRTSSIRAQKPWMVDKQHFSSRQSLAEHRLEHKGSKPWRKNSDFHPPQHIDTRKRKQTKENLASSVPSRIQTKKKEDPILDPHSHSTSQTRKHLPQKILNQKIPRKISPQNRLRETPLENRWKTLKPTKKYG